VDLYGRNLTCHYSTRNLYPRSQRLPVRRAETMDYIDRKSKARVRAGVRKLPRIPSDPRPSAKELNEQMRKHRDLIKRLPREKCRGVAEFFWIADQRQKSPDLFWHPFAPDPMWYEAYLKSAQWRQISSQVKKGAGYKCACCPNEATQVHHRCYRPSVMSGEDTSLLIALCGVCHKSVDFDESEKIRDAHSKERVLGEIFARETERLRRSGSASKLSRTSEAKSAPSLQ
jgi:hypothetical protein